MDSPRPREGGVATGPVPAAVLIGTATRESIDPDAPPIELLAFALRGEEAASRKARIRADALGLATTRRSGQLAAVVTIGVAAAAVHVDALRVARAESATAHSLSERLDAMSTRLESLDANRR